MRLINIKPDRTWSFALAALPFAALLIAYLMGSAMRLAENPNDKLLPSFGAMAEAVKHMALMADPRSGIYLMWNDTVSSMSLLLTALAISTIIALVFGIVIGLLPLASATLGLS
jgi:NitT/TauT family transport system permease protein